MVNYNAELYETELSLLEQSEQLYLNFVNFLSNLYFVFVFFRYGREDVTISDI